MFAVGRKPNIANLGIEHAGVTVADNGGIAVDRYSRTDGRRTSSRSATSPTGST